MSTVTGRAPRQAAVLAAIAGFHIGVYVLVSAGLVPRLASIGAPEPIKLVRLPPAEKPLLVAPRIPGPVDYNPALAPKPSIPIPEFDESPASPIEPGTVPRADAGAGPGEPGTVVQPPSLRTRDHRLDGLIAACYPSASRRLGEEGRVEMRVVIDANGRASASRVERSSGFPRLDAAADCVIRRLDFVPGRRDGHAAVASVLLPVVFRLD
jgi:periplasmic protein TonB